MDISATGTTGYDQPFNDNIPVQEILDRQTVHDTHPHHIQGIWLNSGVTNVLVPSRRYPGMR
jgi:hypothetical protein